MEKKLMEKSSNPGASISQNSRRFKLLASSCAKTYFSIICFQPHTWVIGIDMEQFTKDDLKTDFKVFLANQIGNQTLHVKIYDGGTIFALLK
jgi:hypothetical protein